MNDHETKAMRITQWEIWSRWHWSKTNRWDRNDYA